LQAAVLFRDGLLVALLAARPIRRRNLAALRLGVHLVRRGAAYWIFLRTGETKTRDAYEAPLPTELTPAIERYLHQYRPLLARQRGRWHTAQSVAEGDALWISKDGSAMREIAIYFRIVRITKAAFGEPLHPHLFRHAAATSSAIAGGGAACAASGVLGHRHPSTKDKHYVLATTLDAGRVHQSAVLARRRRAQGRRKERARSEGTDR
jgi:site-specific recombinase XerD